MILDGVEGTGSAPALDSSSRSLDWLWMVLLTLLTLLFFLSFSNRFVGLRSGDGEFTTGAWFLQGRLPYRDYFSATPPLNTLKSALLLKVFGSLLIVSRAAGVAERVLIALVLFQWLRRLFAAPFAFSGSLVTIIVSAGDMVDPIASYNHDAILWAMLSGLAASRALDRRSTGKVLLPAALSGLFAGLSLATKQTVGIGATLGVPLVVALLLLNARTPRRALLWISGFAGGCAAPIVLLALWLHHLHAWRAFLTMAFLQGPAAKGHPADFVRRELLVAADNWIFVLLALVAMACTAAAIFRSQGESASAGLSPHPSASGERRTAVRLGLGFFAVIAAAELLALLPIGALHNLSKAPVYFVFLLCGILFAGYALLSLRSPLTLRQRQFALFAATSFFVAFFLSLSWPAFEAMTLPGLGFLTAAVLSGIRPARRGYVYVVLGAVVFTQVREKLDLPFGFDGLNESPVRLAVVPSRLPELRGMRLSPEMNDFLEGATATIAAHTGPADSILTYPEIGVLYELTNRSYPTVYASHNVDVVNDSLAAEEGARILERRPAVVFYVQHTPEEAQREDRAWRFGKPSGQHRLVAAVEQLARGYRLAAVYPVGQDRRPISVYVRP